VKNIVLNIIGNRRHYAVQTQQKVIQIMKKFTAIIGEVGSTNAHLIQESDRYLSIRSQQILALLLNIKASANVNVSVI
jgi:hypothetical protein